MTKDNFESRFPINQDGFPKNFSIEDYNKYLKHSFSVTEVLKIESQTHHGVTTTEIMLIGIDKNNYPNQEDVEFFLLVFYPPEDIRIGPPEYIKNNNSSPYIKIKYSIERFTEIFNVIKNSNAIHAQFFNYGTKDDPKFYADIQGTVNIVY